MIAITKNADSKPVIIATDWKPSLSLELKGNPTDTIYKNYLLQPSPSFAAVGGDADKHSEATRIKRGIDALSTKIKRLKSRVDRALAGETQIGRRV